MVFLRDDWHWEFPGSLPMLGLFSNKPSILLPPILLGKQFLFCRQKCYELKKHIPLPWWNEFQSTATFSSSPEWCCIDCLSNYSFFMYFIIMICLFIYCSVRYIRMSKSGLLQYSTKFMAQWKAIGGYSYRQHYMTEEAPFLDHYLSFLNKVKRMALHLTQMKSGTWCVINKEKIDSRSERSTSDVVCPLPSNGRLLIFQSCLTKRA